METKMTYKFAKTNRKNAVVAYAKQMESGDWFVWAPYSGIKDARCTRVYKPENLRMAIGYIKALGYKIER